MQILVLSGGASAEREVSLSSGQNVCTALVERGHQVYRLDPSEVDLEIAPLPDCDIVFLALHGNFGEDGQVQSILERRGLCYTGSGPVASSRAFNKLVAKQRFTGREVRTPDHLCFTTADVALLDNEKLNALGWPLFVKPAAQGSSLGVSSVRSREQLLPAMQAALQYDGMGIIEQAVSGSEWTIGFLDELTLPLVRIRPAQQFYDYHAKYLDSATQFEIAPKLDRDIEQELIQTARKAYAAVGATGLARVDLMLDANHTAWVLEVNTIPGMTPSSSIPKAAATLGWSLGELCEKMCDAAFRLRQSRAA